MLFVKGASESNEKFIRIKNRNVELILLKEWQRHSRKTNRFSQPTLHQISIYDLHRKSEATFDTRKPSIFSIYSKSDVDFVQTPMIIPAEIAAVDSCRIGWQNISERWWVNPTPTILLFTVSATRYPTQRDFRLCHLIVATGSRQQRLRATESRTKLVLATVLHAHLRMRTAHASVIFSTDLRAKLSRLTTANRKLTKRRRKYRH